MPSIRTIALLASAGLALAAGPALANYTWAHANEYSSERASEYAESARASTAQPARATQIVTIDDDREIRVEVREGRVRAWIDGKRVADDQIRVAGDGRTTILDCDGASVHELRTGDTFVSSGPGGGNVTGWVTRRGDGSMPAVIVREGQNLARFDPSAGLPPVMIGINHSSVGEALRYHLGVPERSIIIERVIDGLPAAQAGLRRHDILVQMEGQEGVDAGALTRVLRGKSPGDELKVVVRRGDELLPITLELRAYDAAALAMGSGAGLATGSPAPTFPGVPVPPAPPADLAQRQAELEYRELVERLRGPLEGLTIFEGDRLVVPDQEDLLNRFRLLERELEAVAPQFENEFVGRMEAFEQRMDELEQRMETGLDRLFDRLERSLERMERAMRERDVREEREERDM